MNETRQISIINQSWRLRWWRLIMQNMTNSQRCNATHYEFYTKSCIGTFVSFFPFSSSPGRPEVVVAAPSIDTWLRVRGWRKSLVARPTHGESDLMCQSWARFRRAAYLKSRARLRSGTEGGSARRRNPRKEERTLPPRERSPAHISPSTFVAGNTTGRDWLFPRDHLFLSLAGAKTRVEGASFPPQWETRVFRECASSEDLADRSATPHRSSTWDFRWGNSQRSSVGPTLPTRGDFRQDKVRTNDAIN